MNWKKWILAAFLCVLIERFCYFQTGTFSLSKMCEPTSPPSPVALSASIELKQPLRFIGAGKQFYAFETADEKYVVKFLKWSRRRPLPWLERVPLPFHSWKASYLAARHDRAQFLQKSAQIALERLPHETQLVVPQPVKRFTLIDRLGISHTVDSSSTHFYVQRKALNFTTYFEAHPSETHHLLQSFIHTVADQCRQGICNQDPAIDRNYGVVDGEVILMDIGSFSPSPREHVQKILQTLPSRHQKATLHQEIVLELLPLRTWLQKSHPDHLGTFDQLLSEKLDSI